MLNNKQIKLFKTLTEMNGISGQENEISKFLRSSYQTLGFTTVNDNLGSIFAYKPSGIPNAKKVAIIGHMDEVGFIAISITSSGLIKGSKIGGLNPLSLTSQRVTLKTKNGTYLHGAIDATPPHLLKEGDDKIPGFDDFLFDFGFRSLEEAKQAGVYIGAMIVVEGSFVSLNNGQRLLGKAFDNRYSLVLGLEVLEHFKNIDLGFDLYVGGSVQEEVGTRGATTASYLLKPDLAIILDCSPARDSSGDKNEYGRLGDGVLLRYVDASMIAFPELIAFQEECAKKAGVKYQFYNSPGGTDAGIVHKSNDGILTLTHCIVARSIHTNSSIIDTDDYLGAKKSLFYLLSHLNSKVIEKFNMARR